MRGPILLTVLALGATVARAESGLFYLGAGVTHSSLTANNGGTPDLKNNSWKAFAGVRPLNWLAVEADYIDLGSQTANSFGNTFTDSIQLRYKAFAGYAVGFAPIPVPYLDVFGKVGLARWTASGGDTFTSYDPELGTPLSRSFVSLSDKGTQFAWGIGVQAHLSMFGARLEYEQFNIPNTTGAKVASLSAFLNF